MNIPLVANLLGFILSEETIASPASIGECSKHYEILRFSM